MLLLGFIFLPAVLASVRELNVNNYVVKIDGDTLQSIQATDKSTNELNLSNLGLQDIKSNVFDHLSNVKTLNLANNSLSSIPKFAFVNLTNLEHLNLANNRISGFDHAFVGLNHLKTLNVSNNLLKTLERGSLYGLTKSTDVFIRDSSLASLSSGVFENPASENVTPTEPSVEEAHRGVGFKYNPAIHGPSALTTPKPANNDKNSLPPNAIPRVKACIEGGKLKSLEPLPVGKPIVSGCSTLHARNVQGKLSLSGLGISEFEQGWYRLQESEINAIDFDGNQIVRVTAEILNDLPASIKEVTMRNNRIERLEKGIIQNKHISTLDLSNNFISEIADGALENMALKNGLHLDDNRLKDTRFAATLPKNLTKLSLQDNEISEIPAGSFAGLDKLSNLKLDGNNITAIQRQSLRGLPALRFLTLSKNGLRTIEPFAFEDQSFLRVLDLGTNLMSSLHKDLFTGLDILLSLNISGNNFSKITQSTMAGLPYTVHYLFLGYNGIESLSSDSFVRAPILDLSLDGNKISKIDKGSFNLPHLRSLSLKDNLLGEFNGDSFVGLGSLKTLSLAGNGITKVKKGALKSLRSLNILDLSNNPIERLENGALYGLQKTGQRFLRVMNTPIKEIQGGVFDDV